MPTARFATECSLSMDRGSNTLDVTAVRDTSGVASLIISLTIGPADKISNQEIIFTGEEARMLRAHLASPVVTAILEEK